MSYSKWRNRFQAYRIQQEIKLIKLYFIYYGLYDLRKSSKIQVSMPSLRMADLTNVLHNCHFIY